MLISGLAGAIWSVVTLIVAILWFQSIKEPLFLPKFKAQRAFMITLEILSVAVVVGWWQNLDMTTGEKFLRAGAYAAAINWGLAFGINGEQLAIQRSLVGYHTGIANRLRSNIPFANGVMVVAALIVVAWGASFAVLGIALMAFVAGAGWTHICKPHLLAMLEARNQRINDRMKTM
jgi:hypothetical protein